MLIALLWATALGMLALFPGLHFAMVLLVAGPWFLLTFGLANGMLAMAWAVVIARAMHTLAVVYHPVAAANLASADPAQRLNAAGQGKYATWLMGRSLMLGCTAVVLTVSLALALGWVLKVDLIKAFLKTLWWVSVPAIFMWAGFTLWKAKKKISTALVFTASGALGVVALTFPAIMGSTHAMTPLLTGLFGFPILLMTLFERQSPSRKTGTLERVQERDTEDSLKWFGLFTGLMSVVLPGLGTSSVIAFGQDMAETDAEYLTMASVAESTGELLALTLGILGLASRSSDAAVIQKLVEQASGNFALGPSFPFALLGTLLVATLVGLSLVKVVGFPYRLMLAIVPNKLQALVVMAGMAWVVWHHTGTWGLAISLAGTLIHLGARRLGTPNQAFFACLVVPMGLSMLGIHVF